MTIIIIIIIVIMDISSDKQVKSHMRRLGYGLGRETLREKLNLLYWQYEPTPYGPTMLKPK